MKEMNPLECCACYVLKGHNLNLAVHSLVQATVGIGTALLTLIRSVPPSNTILFYFCTQPRKETHRHDIAVSACPVYMLSMLKAAVDWMDSGQSFHEASSPVYCPCYQPFDTPLSILFISNLRQ